MRLESSWMRLVSSLKGLQRTPLPFPPCEDTGVNQEMGPLQTPNLPATCSWTSQHLALWETKFSICFQATSSVVFYYSSLSRLRQLLKEPEPNGKKSELCWSPLLPTSFWVDSGFWSSVCSSVQSCVSRRADRTSKQERWSNSNTSRVTPFTCDWLSDEHMT